MGEERKAFFMVDSLSQRAQPSTNMRSCSNQHSDPGTRLVTSNVPALNEFRLIPQKMLKRSTELTMKSLLKNTPQEIGHPRNYFPQEVTNSTSQSKERVTVVFRDLLFPCSTHQGSFFAMFILGTNFIKLIKNI
uniref:Uncharacterized protein n=1 Tax=Heterorhabditis bacteriophora TaxID=37862 RepID=A0A1I7WAZ7_HETBA